MTAKHSFLIYCIRYLTTGVMLCFIFCANTPAQQGSYTPDPDYLLFACPFISAGTSTFSGDVPPGYTKSTAVSFGSGAFLAIYVNNIAKRIFAVPMLGVQYNSRAIIFTDQNALATTVRINSVNTHIGIAFPFVQFHLSIDFPVSGSSSQHLTQDIDRVVKMHTNELNVTFEPRILFYYGFLISDSRSDVLIPYISIGYPLTNMLRSPYSLNNQAFQMDASAVNILKMSTIQLGITVAIEIERHYPYGEFL